MYLKLKNNSIVLTSLLLVAMSCAPKAKPVEAPVVEEQRLPYYKSADFEPYWFATKTEVAQNIKHRLGAFSFVNQYNDNVTEKDVKGKIHVANFFFTTCGSICPLMTGEFERLQQAFKNDADVLLLSFSVDPKQDDVATLKEYAVLHGAIQNKWHLLTGKKEELYHLARTFYFAEKMEGLKKDAAQFLHTENFILVDKGGYIRGIYSGTLSQETDRLIADIKKLEKEE